MPWKECKPMDERLRFVARLLEGEKMAPLCREFGISRVTGYKIFNRYKGCGLDVNHPGFPGAIRCGSVTRPSLANSALEPAPRLGLRCPSLQRCAR